MAPATPSAIMAVQARERDDRPEQPCGGGGERRDQGRDRQACQRSGFDHRVARDQIVDRGGVDIDAGDRADPRACDDRRAFGRAARRARALDAGRKALRRHAAILDIENGAEDDDLAVEPAPEIILVVLDGARTQVGKREGRDVVGAAFEIQRHRVRHPARDLVAGKRHPAALVELRRGAQRP